MTDMAHRLAPLANRVAALGLLAGLIWATIALVALPAIEHYADGDEAILDARRQLGRIQSVFSGGQQVASAEPQDFEGQSWAGKSQSIIAAKLQEFLQTRARANDVGVISISPLQTRPFEKFKTIGLRIECEGEVAAIRDLIGELENNTPFIFINGTEMRRQPIFGERQPGQRLPLSVRLDIYAPTEGEEG